MSTRSISVRLNTVEVPVSDLARAVDWYAQCLGLESAWSDAHHALLEGATEAGDNASHAAPRLLLVETEDPLRLGFGSTRTGVSHSVVDFITDDLDGLHERLVAAGAAVNPLGPPENDWAPRGFAFEDPDGNRLGAFAYGD